MIDFNSILYLNDLTLQQKECSLLLLTLEMILVFSKSSEIPCIHNERVTHLQATKKSILKIILLISTRFVTLSTILKP